MANSTQITVLDSASATATVSTLDAFVSGTATMSSNLAMVGGTTVSTGSGVMTAGTQRMALATDSPGVIGTGSAGSSSTTVLTVQGIVGMTGLNVINSTASLLNANVSGSIGVIPQTVGGLLLSSTIATASTNTTIVKGSAGQLYHIACTNNTATIAYLKFYNATTNGNFTTLTPVWRVMIPGSSTGGAGIVDDIVNGLAFSTGICFATTANITDTDSTVVTNNALIINIGYK